MGTSPEVDVQESDSVDELAAALGASKKEEAVQEVKEEKVEEKVEEEKPAIPPSDDKTAELRQIIRTQNRQIAVMEQKLARLEKRSERLTPKDKDDADDFFEEGKKKEEVKTEEVKVSELESLQHDIVQLGQVKGPVLETLIEVMEQNPKYADVRDVCSQNNFDDMFDAIGQAVAEKEGIDPMIASLKAEKQVWAMANPYKYMYGLIKQYHPSYAKADSTDSKGTGVKAPAKAPSTIVDKGGGDSGKQSGWTAKRIDEMPEEDLRTVPKEVYDKYLRGDLD